MADYLKEAKKAQQSGDFLRAGDLYLLAGLSRQAITAYIQGAHYINAARLLEKEQDWRAAGRYYGQASKFDKAAELFRKANDFAMASNMYEKANQLASASEMAASARDFARAAQLAEQAGQREKAAEYYVQVQDLDRATQIYADLLQRAMEAKKRAFHERHVADIKKFGNALGSLYERIGDWRGAAKCYLEAQSPAQAAAAYEEYGDLESAAEIYSKIGDYFRAASAYEKMGSLNKATDMAEKAGNLSWVAELAERTGQIMKAANCYAQTGQLDKAAELLYQHILTIAEQEVPAAESVELRKYANAAGALYVRTGNAARAAWCFEHAENYSKAAECYLQANNESKAAELFYRIGDYQKSYDLMASLPGNEKNEALAHACLELGKFEEAAKIFVHLNQSIPAARAYEKMNDPARAAFQYKQAGELEKAADLYAAVKEDREAAHLYRQAGKFLQAAPLFEATGMREEAADSYLHGKDLFSAARLFAGIGNSKKALELLEQIPEDRPEYKDASVLSGSLLVAGGMDSAVAQKKLLQGLAGQTMTRDNMEPYYYLGVALENTKQLDKALKVYEKILAMQSDYKDLPLRLQRVKDEQKSMVRKTSAPPPPPAAAFASQALLQALRPGTPISPPTAPPTAPAVMVKEAGPAGNRIREYEILETLGKGRMGTVYRCRHTLLKKERAIKVLSIRLSQSKFVERFIQEASILSDIHNKHLAQFFELGTLDDGRFYMVLEMIPGESVSERVWRNGPIPIADSIRIVREAADGLESAHQKGIVHRDISPDNLMLAREENAPEITKVIDFGIAWALNDDGIQYTEAAMFPGRPEYASPEQCGLLQTGQKVDARSDIYSLAATLYYMVCGKPPFASPDPKSNLREHVSAREPRSLSEQMPPGASPRLLEMIIMKALNKEREKRQKTIREFAQDIDELPRLS